MRDKNGLISAIENKIPRFIIDASFKKSLQKGFVQYMRIPLKKRKNITKAIMIASPALGGTGLSVSIVASLIAYLGGTVFLNLSNNYELIKDGEDYILEYIGKK